MLRRRALEVLIVALGAYALAGTPAAVASDAYFVRFAIPNDAVVWSDDILFLNTNATPVTVRFLGVSNGNARVDVPSLELPPLRTTSLASTPSVARKWSPDPLTGLWILHLDVPAGVVVESRDEFYRQPPIPELTTPIPRGKVSLPVFRELRPASEPQVHLGTDLGGFDSHINVGVFNAGGVTGVATIEVRRTCDDAVVDTRAVSVPPNTVLQVSGLRVEQSSVCTDSRTTAWARYVRIVVDQPSLTFVSTVNSELGQFNDGLPVVGLSISRAEAF